jgi:hypothetical protein
MSTFLTAEHKRLVELLQESRVQTQASLLGIESKLVIYPEIGWRVKDIVAHLTAWEEEAIKSLEAYRRGEEYQIEGFSSDDEYNAKVFAERKDFTVTHVCAEWEKTHERLIAQVRQMEPWKLKGPVLCPWGARGTVAHMIEELVKHEQEHVRDIVAVTAANKTSTD